MPKSSDTLDLDNNFFLNDLDNQQDRIASSPNFSNKSNMKNNVLFTGKEDIREL